ncbi:MAG: RNA polymerase sigma factor SigZ [Saprospiraceae bacterium]|nr:RNA polymerase sigma factor SigZ [Saprospiraceae bacterium]
MNRDVERIWTDFHRELKSFVMSKVGNTTDADDILQNAFLKIIKNQSKVEQAENVHQYLFGILRNSIIDYYRDHKNAPVDIDQFNHFSEEEESTLNQHIAACCIQPFISRLPEKYRQVLMLTELSDYSQKELANQLNMSYSGLKSRVQRGRAKLRQLITDCCALESDTYGNLRGDTLGDCSC